MKKLSLLLILLFFAFTPSVKAQTKIKAYLDTKQFYAPEIGPYLEVYINLLDTQRNLLLAKEVQKLL